MKNAIVRSFASMLVFISITLGAPSASAAYYPEDGWLYYDGQYLLFSYMWWDKSGPWGSQEPGYEHDLHIHDENFFTTRCTAITSLPDGYDDCPTAGIFDANGPVFSFGSFDAELIKPSQWYYGYWRFNTHGSANTSKFRLMGQENKSKCPGGYESIWCMFSVRTKPLIDSQVNWQGYPSWLKW